MNLYVRLLLLVLRSRRRPRLSLWDTARTPFRVAPTDLDLLRHMTNGKYLTIMDLGRIDLMLRSGFWKKIKERGWYPVVAGQTITYRKSLRPGQRFDLYTRVVGFDDRWVYMQQRFCVGETVYAQAYVRARFLKRSGGSVEHEELLALAGDVPEDLEPPEWLVRWTASSRFAPESRPTTED